LVVGDAESFAEEIGEIALESVQSVSDSFAAVIAGTLAPVSGALSHNMYNLSALVGAQAPRLGECRLIGGDQVVRQRFQGRVAT